RGPGDRSRGRFDARIAERLVAARAHCARDPVRRREPGAHPVLQLAGPDRGADFPEQRVDVGARDRVRPARDGWSRRATGNTRVILADAGIGTHPSINLGCGPLCTFNYDSVISSLLAIAVTIGVAFW